MYADDAPHIVSGEEVVIQHTCRCRQTVPQMKARELTVATAQFPFLPPFHIQHEPRRGVISTVGWPRLQISFLQIILSVRKNKK